MEDPKIYFNIKDPFHNREQIKSVCKGVRVIYIWTYLPTGICLVGSSSNSIERVLSYFETKYLFLDNRRGVQFLANYGFKNIQLSIIPLDPKVYSLRDCRILEQYYLDQLNSVLNVQRFVNTPDKTNLTIGAVETNRDAAKPILVYGPDLKRVLYIFKSKTSLYLEFKLHRVTLVKILDVPGEFYLDYFYFSTKILPDSDLNNTVDLNELLTLKTNAPVKPKIGNIAIILTDTLNASSSHSMECDNKLVFRSYTAAAKYIKTITGKSDRLTMQKCCCNKTLYQNRWKIEEVTE